MDKIRKAVGMALSTMILLLLLPGCGEKQQDTTVWKIGAIGPVTGDNAAYGIAVRNGMELALEEINAAGGIKGVPLVLQFEDDIADTGKATEAYEQLRTWGMDILVGCTTSSCSIAVAEKTAEDHLFQLIPTASAAEAASNENVFLVCLTDPDQGTGAARYIGEKGMASQAAIIYREENSYSYSIYKKFMEEAEKQPFTVAFAENLDEANLAAQLKRIQDSQADILFLPVYYQDVSLILTEAASVEYTPLILGCDGLEGILTGVNGFDVALAEGTMMLTHFAADSTEEAAVRFTTDYEKKFHMWPNQFAADAYDAVYILKKAIEESDVSPQEDTADICRKLQYAMKEISYDGLTGEDMTWNQNGEVNKLPRVVKIENGAYTAAP